VIFGVGEIADGLLAADDGAVRAALGQELTRLQKAEPAAALGVARDASPDDVRARFLALVKVYHPNRFARRPADVVRLSNEVFLLLRRAAQRLGERPSGTGNDRVTVTNGAAHHAAAGTPAPTVASRASELSPPTQPRLEVDAALARRRRNRSQPSSSMTSAPPPALTSEMQEKLRRREEEQRERFDGAVADARQGRLPSARNALRALAAESPSSRPYRAHLHYVTGRMHEAAGRTGEAIAEYDRALGFDSELDEARRSRAALVGGGAAQQPDSAGGAGRFGRWFRK
jgi:tetratricopeptide (TPR) repeat protein